MTRPEETQAPSDDEDIVEDPFPDMDIDAAVQYLIHSDGDATRVPAGVLFKARRHLRNENLAAEIESTAYFEADFSDAPTIPESYRDFDRLDAANADEGSDAESVSEFGYAPLSEGGEDELDDEGDDFADSANGNAGSADRAKGSQCDETPAVFTIDPAGSADDSFSAESNGQSIPNDRPMSREDELLIKSVMGSLAPPSWAADASFESKLQEVMVAASAHISVQSSRKSPPPKD